jgi:hypothetical protein
MAAADTTVRADSRVVLQAPLEKDRSWTSFREPFLSRRAVTERTAIETRAGRFDVVKLETTLPEMAPSLRWFDYVSSDGLVRRVVTDTLERRDEEGAVAGDYLFRESYELTDHQD